jgi:undecaprenyl diphosphate synthase
MERLPKHVGIIMDGNRRWAKEHGFQTVFKGHEVGADKIESIVAHAKDKGIESLSFWAFSTDNWQREKPEVKALMGIFRKLLSGPMVKNMVKEGVKINTIGDMSKFPEDIQKKAKDVIAQSEKNNAIAVNLGLSYGGREEIVFAANNAFKKALKEGRTEITQEDISSHLYTKDSEVELIIRTGGEQRHSGFLLWQSKNTEYYYTDKKWPDFDEKEFDKALEDYAARDRRFGK